MYTIKHAAELTGLSPATLRAWERRYGIGTPHRTAAGYRLYDEQAVQSLTLMAALVTQGWSPSQAADETKRRIADGAQASGPVGGARSLSAAGARGTDPGDIPAPNGRRSPDAPVTPPADGLDRPSPPAFTGVAGPPIRELAEAAARLDAVRLTAVLDEGFSIGSFETVVDGWLMPSLVALGEAWAEGQVSVAGEHLASYTVMRRLAAAFEAASYGATGQPIVVGLPPGSRHELGVLAFAVAARRAGLRTAYVGADLPAEDWVSAVRADMAQAAVLAALQEKDLPALMSVVSGLRAAHPDLIIAVGGALQEQAPDGCLLLGHQIGAGAQRLAASLAGSR